MLEEYRKKRRFDRTPEPSGGSGTGAAHGGGLRFVVQKHDASHLHHDLRLEMGGAMKSWAVPKGPSLDPSVRRLAMEVEDHPIEYNDFEGTIPKGEYGGGTVMLWDRGTYRPDGAHRGETPEHAAVRGYRAGKLTITLEGDRLRGSFSLLRTDGEPDGVRSRWLLVKQRDDDSVSQREITEEVATSVATGRTMEEIAAGKGGGRVWRSNRGGAPAGDAAGDSAVGGAEPEPVSGAEFSDPTSLRPMLASTAAVPPPGEGWTFEPKYDGIRVLALVTPGGVALITRNGRDKARQFPEVARALAAIAEDAGSSFILDGELVGVAGGRIVRFESLQGRMHLADSRRIASASSSSPAAFVAFDALLVGNDVLTDRRWPDRRERLTGLLAGRQNDRVILGETSDDRGEMEARAAREGWEGLIAKRKAGRYRPGQRSPDWVKLKMENQQEMVVGGWTEPRKSRAHLGAVLLGYYEDGKLVYAGHTGTGFDRNSLAEMSRRLRRLERKTPPFRERPRTNEPAHWVTPKVVVQVRFNEWTRDGKLRQPVFLGFRDDRDPLEVRREPPALSPGNNSGNDHPGLEAAAGEDPEGARKSRAKKPATAEARHPQKPNVEAKAKKPAKTRPGTTTRAPAEKLPKNAGEAATNGKRRAGGRQRRGAQPGSGPETPVAARLLELLDQGEGSLDLDGAETIAVTSLDKVFFPETGHTKGDLLLYYVRLADRILPWMADRPLVLKRFPNGVEGESFYQQAAPDSPPSGVRVETLEIEEKEQRRLVGGNLATLLYTIQLGAISYDPWHSRVTDLRSADYTILDLDPGPETPFGTVVEVALRVREAMDEFGLEGGLKTSGSSGLHIYLPLPVRTPLDAATLVARIVATRVAREHPEIATVERMTRNRPAGTVYVDYLQNILGKTVAGVYAARAKAKPMVSAPLAWDELDDDLDLRDFTIDTMPARLAERGDLWSAPMSSPNDLRRLLTLAGGGAK